MKYQIDFVTLEVPLGVNIEDVKAQLVQAALDHGAARMVFNDKPYIVRREWLIEAVKLQA